MTEKRILILFISGMLLLEFLVLGGLKSLGVSNEDLVLAYLLLLTATAFGAGHIVMHYHR